MSGRTYSRNIPHRSIDSRDSRDSRDYRGESRDYREVREVRDSRDDRYGGYTNTYGYGAERERREYVRDDSKHQERKVYESRIQNDDEEFIVRKSKQDVRDQRAKHNAEEQEKKNPSICIPRAFPTIKGEPIKRVVFDTFKELRVGHIERIDVVHKKDAKGDTYCTIYVHLIWSQTGELAKKIRSRLMDGNEVKIVYDEPWFWKCTASHTEKPQDKEKPKGKPYAMIDETTSTEKKIRTPKAAKENQIENDDERRNEFRLEKENDASEASDEEDARNM